MVTRKPRDTDQLTITTSSFRRLYRVQKHLEFTNFCLEKRLVPKFCKVSYKPIQLNLLTIADIKKWEHKRLLAAQLENQEKQIKYKFEFDQNV